MAGDISPARDERGEILDVDTWVSSNGNNKGKETAQAETSYLEYSLPLADEPRATQPPPPDLVSPSRRASQASHLLTQSLTHPPVPNMRPPARSASASTLHLNPRTPVKTRGRTRPPPAPQAASDGGAAAKPDDDPMGGKRSNARMPGSLDVLKNCIIFVDVRTEEGEDAAALFVDMLRGLGARVCFDLVVLSFHIDKFMRLDPLKAGKELHAPGIQGRPTINDHQIQVRSRNI